MALCGPNHKLPSRSPVPGCRRGLADLAGFIFVVMRILMTDCRKRYTKKALRVLLQVGTSDSLRQRTTPVRVHPRTLAGLDYLFKSKCNCNSHFKY